jgi:hypothetical protein
MSMRYLSNATIALFGGFVAVASQAFAPAVTAWLAFAIAIAVLVVAGVSQLQRGRGVVQRLLDGVTGLLAVGAIIASLVFVGPAVVWLSLAAGLGFVLLGFVGLTLHEIWTYRATHGLTVRTFEAPELARADGVRSAA